jgi:hypothetical protein
MANSEGTKSSTVANWIKDALRSDAPLKTTLAHAELGQLQKAREWAIDDERYDVAERLDAVIAKRAENLTVIRHLCPTCHEAITEVYESQYVGAKRTSNNQERHDAIRHGATS